MTPFAAKNSFFKYLNYDNEPRWFNIFIHTGFGAAILTAIGVVLLAWLL